MFDARRLTVTVFLLAWVCVSGCREDADRPDDREVAQQDALRTDQDAQSYMGREIAPVRGHELAEWFDRPDREYSELPDRLVRALPLDSSDVVADIGAGTGYFTFRLAEIVTHGRVLAVDIDPAMLEMIRGKMREQDVTNIEPIESTPSDPRLPTSSVDLALIVDSYHEFSHPGDMLDGILQGLRPGGQLVIVEYRGEDDTIDVDELHRMTEAQIRTEVEAAGYEWVETRDFLPQQHVVIFRRPVS